MRNRKRGRIKVGNIIFKMEDMRTETREEIESRSWRKGMSEEELMVIKCKLSMIE